MQFHEFGSSENRTILLLDGLPTGWEGSFGSVIPLLSNKYHIITIEPCTTPDTVPATPEDEISQIEDYITANCSGSIHGIYAASFGCATALALYFNRNITFEYMILDGLIDLSYGTLTKPFAALSSKVGFNHVKAIMKLYGPADNKTLGSLEQIDPALSTLQNTYRANYNLFDRLPTGFFTDVSVACWYGGRDLFAPRGAKELRKKFPLMEEKIFRGYTQGGLLSHPNQAADEIDKFLSAAQTPTQLSVTNFKITPIQKKLIGAAAVGLAATATLSAFLLSKKNTKNS